MRPDGLARATWTAPRPINVFVIEHRDGLVLFDTGQDRASVTDPDYFPSGVTGAFYRRTAKADIAEDQTLTAGLTRLGYHASDVGAAIVSHLHQDHIGGLAELSGASIHVSQAEWDTMAEPRAELNGLMRNHIDLPGLTWTKVMPEPTTDRALEPFTVSRDLFGDGILVLIPTPGHTPGSGAEPEPGGVLLIEHWLPYADRDGQGWARWLPGHRSNVPREWPTEGERRRMHDGDELELFTRLGSLDPLAQQQILELRARLWHGGAIVREEVSWLSENLYFAQELLLMLVDAGFRNVSIEGPHTGRPATDKDATVIFVARRPWLGLLDPPHARARQPGSAVGVAPGVEHAALARPEGFEHPRPTVVIEGVAPLVEALLAA